MEKSRERMNGKQNKNKKHEMRDNRMEINKANEVVFINNRGSKRAGQKDSVHDGRILNIHTGRSSP